MSRVTKSDISLDMEFWVDELSPSQLAAYERVANEHNAIKGALKNALTANEGKELFSGQVFQAYSFKGKVLQEIREAALPKKPPKAAEPPPAIKTYAGRGSKRASNIAYLESSDEEDDDVPLAKRLALGKKNLSPAAQPTKAQKKNAAAAVAAASSGSPSGKSSLLGSKSSGKGAATANKTGTVSKQDKVSTANVTSSLTANFKPCEINSVGGLVVGTSDAKKDGKDNSKDNAKETKMQGKTYPSLVVLAKPYLKIKDMAATRNKLDSKVKLVLMLTPNKFCEWLIQEGLLRSAQTCVTHRNSELKLGVYSDAAKFPFTGGYVWISECCPLRFVSVFHNSIFEGAQHPPSCILKLIYHWACQTSIQNVVQWVKVDSVYIKGIYTWLRAICTLAVHQKCKKLGGPDKYVEVGVISLGTTSQDGQQRQVKVEVLGVYDYSDKSIRLRAVEPIADGDRNYKKRFQTILEPLQRWVHKDSIVCIDLTVDKISLYSMGFKNIVQASATDTNAKHNNSAVMEYLRRIVPRMFQNTLSLLSRQMIQQFLDELVWRESFGTYALQAFNNITSHIAEQTRVIATETLTQRLYQVATNPFKDWSILPPNYKEMPANHTPKRLKKPINDSDYANLGKEPKQIKKESLRESPSPAPSKRRGATIDDDYRPERKTSSPKTTGGKHAAPASKQQTTKSTPAKAGATKKPDVKLSPVTIKKEDNDLQGLEEMYYGVCDGHDQYFEAFPSMLKPQQKLTEDSKEDLTVSCPICNSTDDFDSNEKLQTHLVSHLSTDGKEHQFQCLFCLDKHQSEDVLAKHNLLMHPAETKTNGSPSYHCLICQQRHNSLNHLMAHLQKVHNMLELPYRCQACGYRSSSHRDLVRHYYDDHKNQNFLQCPFCLDIFYFYKGGQVSKRNIVTYFMHLQAHVAQKDATLHCQKCALSFVDRGALKQHVAHHHVSMTKTPKYVRILLNNSVLVLPPKVRTHHREQLPYTQQKLSGFHANISDANCVECNTMIVCDKHYGALLTCTKCNYKTCCERAIFKHASVCNGNAFIDGMEISLPHEMHCICGFATANGNKMAQHMATCGQKSCYPTIEIAHENTVKRNMLDMLGLVRRDGETGEGGGVVDDIAVVNEDQLESAEQQQSEDRDDVHQQYESSAEQNAGSDALEANTHVQQEPIQFGEMEAAPVMLETDQQVVANEAAAFTQIVDAQQQSQYTISFGQTEVPAHALNASDIDMPLIGELADPNPPPTPQFLGEVHTPMFDAVAAAEQQHYHYQQQQQQPPHHHNPHHQHQQ